MQAGLGMQLVLSSCTQEITFCWYFVLEAVTPLFECLFEIQTQRLTSNLMTCLISRLRSSFYLDIKAKQLWNYHRNLHQKLPAFNATGAR